jgi:hypothetical protein
MDIPTLSAGRIAEEQGRAVVGGRANNTSLAVDCPIRESINCLNEEGVGYVPMQSSI